MDLKNNDSGIYYRYLKTYNDIANIIEVVVYVTKKIKSCHYTECTNLYIIQTMQKVTSEKCAVCYF